jgi:hypothetical protein
LFLAFLKYFSWKIFFDANDEDDDSVIACGILHCLFGETVVAICGIVGHVTKVLLSGLLLYDISSVDVKYNGSQAVHKPLLQYS